MARFMPDTWPIPALDRFNRPYFTAGKVVVQQCTACGSVQHPPEEICHNCHAMDFTFRETSGRGTVHSFIVVHHPGTPALQERAPYVVALVALDDHPHVRIIGNVINRRPDEVAIGQPVRATFEEIPDPEAGETIQLPQWEAM